MTHIAFHFNAPDKLAYACRFVRKALSRNAQVTVVAGMPLLTHLSARLWKSQSTDFLAHVVVNANNAEEMLSVSPVVLSEDALESPHRHVLLNLGEQIPSGFEAFSRVIEVVSLDDMDRSFARERWKAYAAQGLEIERFDLVLKGN